MTKGAARKAYNPPTVTPQIAEGVRADPGMVQLKLGSNTWCVWLYLIHHREPNGEVTRTRADIVRARPLTKHQVQYALKRLKRFGLATPLKRLPARKGFRWRGWKVEGDYRNGKLVLPKDVAEALLSTPKHQHGGPRMRKETRQMRQSKDPAYTSKFLDREAEQVPRYTRTLPLGPKFFSKEKNGSASALPALSSFLAEGVTESALYSSLKPLRDPDDRGRWLFPPDPNGNRKFKRARAKGPPTLPSSATDDVKVAELVKAYRGAVERYTGERCWKLARGGADKYRAQLLAAAAKLEEHNLSPGMWAMWSVSLWYSNRDRDEAPEPKAKRKGGKRRARGKSPPVTFVFNAWRIDSKRGWFRDEMGSFAGGRLYRSKYFDRYKRLRNQYLSAFLKLVRAGDATWDDVRALADEYFPPGERYEDFVELNNDDVREEQNALDALMEKGNYTCL